MKNYFVVAVLVAGSIGLGWFLMSGSSAPTTPETAVTENQESNGMTEVSVPAVTADPVAMVNGEEISNADFTAQQTQALSAQGVDPSTLDSETQIVIQDQVVDSLVSQELLRQAVRVAGVEVAEAEVDAQIETIRSQFEDEATYEAALAAQALTETELREQLAADLGVEPYLEQTLNLSSITVSDEEVNQVYEEAARQQELPPLAEVSAEVEQLALQQKQQLLVNQHIATLEEVAEIEIYI